MVGRDNRVRLDPEYIKMLRMEASLNGYCKLTEYTKDKAKQLEENISNELIVKRIPLGGFINKGTKNEKTFKFGF